MSRKIRVLMVDDEERFRTITARILERKGYETVIAASGEEALEMLSENPDVVILDVKMGGMDGHETLKKIKQTNPDLPVIMLTGHGALPSAQESLRSGAYDYLTKPCDVDLLAAKIKDAHFIRERGITSEPAVGDIMIPIENYTTIAPDATLRQGIEKIKASFSRLLSTDRLMVAGHRSILVFEGDANLVGILGVKDLIAALRPAYLSAGKPTMADSMQYSPMFWTGLFTNRVKTVQDIKVGDVMSARPPMIEADVNLMEAAEMLFERKARRLVVKSKGRIVGVMREQELFFEMARLV
jgi:CheY-like chemotaxis protein